MDNGLIFPYRRENDPAEVSDAKHARRIVGTSVSWCVESVIRSHSRQAAEGRRKVVRHRIGLRC